MTVQGARERAQNQLAPQEQQSQVHDSAKCKGEGGAGGKGADLAEGVKFPGDPSKWVIRAGALWLSRLHRYIIINGTASSLYIKWDHEVEQTLCDALRELH